ncbi:methyltransferase domain-containing protein [Hyphomicrobium sp.]|jgi:SAM-dependent methyltransferase|uniref:methyltransferase domain-containing protein n=1 Tax=Hyphomicrobium sp. TaxID=82 RepID=UPI00356267CF
MSSFDEEAYLTANPDVAAAVSSGALASGAAHYAMFGVSDRRALNLRMRPAPLKLPFPKGAKATRRDKILANLDLSELKGLEIGALASPLVWPEEGDIFFVDHADTDDIRAKYANDPSVDNDNIVQINAVWGSQTLSECIGIDNKVDYVVASHVIEHVPDLITWLAEIRSILKATGSLRLAVPDRRYTFDFLRFETRIHDVLDAYLRRARAPTPRMIIEHCTYIRVVDCAAAWNGTLDIQNLRPHSSTKLGIEAAKDSIVNGTYHDSHCWIFTPITFAELCKEMAELDLLTFACAHYIETPRNELEFYVHMVPSDDKNSIIESWERMKKSLLESETYQKSPQNMGAPMKSQESKVIVSSKRENILNYIPGIRGSKRKLKRIFRWERLKRYAAQPCDALTMPVLANDVTGLIEPQTNSAPQTLPHTKKNFSGGYVKSAPSAQNVIDMFNDDWSSAMPTDSTLVAKPGFANLFEDGRIRWAEEILGGFVDKSLLELGPLEGAHSYMLQKAGARSVVAVEANTLGFLKCLCIKEIFNLDRVQFKLGDFSLFLDTVDTKFDAVIASGVLYHMTDPIGLLSKISKVTDKLYVWTHYYDEDAIRASGQLGYFKDYEVISSLGKEGIGAKRYYRDALQWNGFCGGSEPYAIWLTKDTILNAARELGLNQIDITLDHPNHPNGPSFAFCAQRRVRES